MKEDKIFNNRFNTGDLEFEVFGAIKLAVDGPGDDIYEEYIEQRAQEDLYKIFIASPYYDDFVKNRKVGKSSVAEIYYYFDERLPGSEDVTAVERFISIAEFMNIPYEVLYQELAPTYKERLLRELDAKYHVFAKKRIKRLF